MAPVDELVLLKPIAMLLDSFSIPRLNVFAYVSAA
jgi:hypothetical protein